ncbi:MAG: hypothetical protein ACOYWZ_19565 [Bacillota bacterium]
MKADLYQYLERIVSTCPYPITFSGDKHSNLNRWLIKGEAAHGSQSDNTEPFLNIDGKILLDHELAFLKQEYLESNWRYYISDNQDTHYQTNTPEKKFVEDNDKYIYSLCNVYCKKHQEVFLFIATCIPSRVWINGRIVHTSSFFYNYTREANYTSFIFKPGNNIVLLERQISLNRAFLVPANLSTFHLSFAPCKDTKSELLIFDKELCESRGKSYTIIPDRGIYPIEQEIGLVVLPVQFKGELEEKIRVSVFNSKGEIVMALNTSTSKKTYLDTGQTTKGALLIKAESIENPVKSAYVYVFKGILIDEVDQLLERAGKRQDCPDSIADSIKKLAQVPDETTAFITGTREVIPQYLLNFILEKVAQFESYLDSGESSDKKEFYDVFKNSAVVFKDSEIDDGFDAYSIYFPKGYDPKKKYPLVVNIQFGYGMSKYPLMYAIYMQQGWFGDFIVAGICGRGGLNRDYISEAGIVKTIGYIVERHNIDRDRIFGLGGCTGALRTLSLAVRKPDLFAAAASILGTPRMDLKNPEYEYLKNIDNMTVYSVCSIEDNIFNCSRVLDALNYMKKVRRWEYYNFNHMNFCDYVENSKLLDMLIKEKREKFPKKIQYTTHEPIYNKSHWISIDHIDDLNHEASIKAEIKGRNQINVETKNIKNFCILLATELMEIDRHIMLRINDKEQTINTGKYAKVLVTWVDGSFLTCVNEISEDEFLREYDSIDINEDLMGIKQVYFKKCRIIKPDYYKNNKKSFSKRLFYVLQYPLKERNRNYRYDISLESELNFENLGESNFVYVIDPRQPGDMQQRILNSAGLKIHRYGIGYGQMEYKGDYFAVIKCENPLDKEKLSVLIVYNSDEVEDELIKFLNSFDTNSLFYSDAVIYNNGSYHSHRKLKRIINKEGIYNVQDFKTL